MNRVATLILAFGIGVGGFLFFTRSNMRELDSAVLLRAKQTWQSQGPKNYTMNIQLSGVQTGHHVVQVSKGTVIAMTTNAQPAAEHTWKYWSMDGMFSFLEEELSLQSSQPNKKIYLDAEFDAGWGYPIAFRRQVFAENENIEWAVSVTVP